MKTFFYTILLILGTVSMPTLLSAQAGTTITYVDNFGTVTLTFWQTVGGKHYYRNTTDQISLHFSTVRNRWETYYPDLSNLVNIMSYSTKTTTSNPPNFTVGAWVNTIPANVTLAALSGSGTTATVLPIELISFTGKNEKTESGNLLTWATATETNNKGFDIETSKDGVNFQALEFVKGRGTTSETQNYTFTHRLSKNESGIQYYRLKQMDFDGQFEYSKIIVVRSEGKQNSIAVYPNPSNGLYTISLDEKAEIEQISLMSITGQSLDVNMTNNQLDLSNEPIGVYFLQVNGQNIKLIKN